LHADVSSFAVIGTRWNWCFRHPRPEVGHDIDTRTPDASSPQCSAFFENDFVQTKQFGTFFSKLKPAKMNRELFRIFFEDYEKLALFLIPDTGETGCLTGVSLWYSLSSERPVQRVTDDMVAKIFEPQLSEFSNGVYMLYMKPLLPMQLVSTSKCWRVLYPFQSIFAPLDCVKVSLKRRPFSLSVSVHGTYRKTKEDKGITLTNLATPSTDFAAKISKLFAGAN
jgi:hypothetical protein